MSNNHYQYPGNTASSAPYFYSQPSPGYQASYNPSSPYDNFQPMSYSLSSQSTSSSGSSYHQGTMSPSQMHLSSPYEASHYVQPEAHTYSTAPSTSSTRGFMSKADKSYPCLVPGCSSAAKGAKFTRAADLDRHVKTVHYPNYTDCPHIWCGRTGRNGFSRKDHLNEHLKQMHMGVPVPQKKR